MRKPHTTHKDGKHKSHSASQKGESVMRHDPDKGNPMIEGEMPFDMGYTHQKESQDAYLEDGHMRGNDYSKLTAEIKSRDQKKFNSNKFSKIA